MGVQSLTNNFVEMTRARVKDIAVFELFDGVYTKSSDRLAIDYIVPVIFPQPDEKFEIHLVARVGYELDGQSVVGIVRAKGYFTPVQVCDRHNWPMSVEAIAYPLVLSLKNVINSLNEPTLRLLQKGEMHGSQHNMKRIWV